MSVLVSSSLAVYPAVRVDQTVAGWTANVRTSYAMCHSGDFKLNYGEFHVEPRGYCLLTHVAARMFNGNKSISALPYTSTGTSYSHFEIVKGGPRGFCVRRIGTQCAG